MSNIHDTKKPVRGHSGLFKTKIGNIVVLQMERLSWNGLTLLISTAVLSASPNEYRVVLFYRSSVMVYWQD